MHRPSREAGTWGCGYAKPIAGIQYTGKSFAKTLVDMCHAILPSTTRYTPITTEEIFPKDRAHMSADMDLVDYTVINAGVRGLDHVLEVFQFIQNGNLQRYIVYGLVYIMVLVASVLIF